MSRTGPDSPPPPTDAQRFTALWEEHAPSVLAYASRHTDRENAQEIVSETFLIAWRRLADVPGDPLPWLLVVARHTVKNHQRSGYRRSLMHDEVIRLHGVAAPAPGADDLVTERAAVLGALAALTLKEREALLLIAWDGLSPVDAARVAGCSVPTLHVRLFRARRRLQLHDASYEATDSLAILTPRSAS